jgi:hypothetical protein
LLSSHSDNTSSSEFGTEAAVLHNNKLPFESVQEVHTILQTKKTGRLLSQLS